MPCYIRAASRLGVNIPAKTDPEKLEDILMKKLDIVDEQHEKLKQRLEEEYEKDPVKLKELLEKSIGEATEDLSPPDRLKKLQESYAKANRRVIVEEVQQ